MNDTNCENGFTYLSEFKIFDTCEVFTVADVTLKSISIGLIGIFLSYMIFMTILKREEYRNKAIVTQVLLRFSIIVTILMLLRPAIGLATSLRSANSLLLSYITHISACGCATMATLFVYFQLDILHNASMSKDNSCTSKHRKKMFIFMGIFPIVIFLIGPVISYYVPLVGANRVFWAPVILVDFTVIPYSLILGISLYKEIKQMQHKDRFDKLGRRILIVVISCTLLGIFTGTAGIVAFIGYYTIEWILIELCWISAIIFVGFIFFILGGNKKTKEKPISTRSSTISSHSNTKSVITSHSK